MFCFNLDYLILNLEVTDKTDFQSIPENFEFKLKEYGTKNLSKLAEIRYNGEELGILTYAPYSGSVIEENFAQFQLSNKFLYESPIMLRNILNELFSELHLNFTGFNRIDLALDFNKNFLSSTPVESWLFDLPKLLFDENECRIDFIGRAKNIAIHTDTNRQVKGWSFGKRNSDRFIRFYNKSLELQQVQNKPHIHDFWDLCRFGEDHSNIWRFEIQLNRRFLTELNSLDYVFNRANLIELFQISLRNFFEPVAQIYNVKTGEKRKRITNCPPIPFIDFEKLKSFSRIDVDQQFERKKRNKTEIEVSTVLQNKILAKKMFFRYLESEQTNLMPLIFLREILDIKSSFDYWTFFWDKWRYWEVDFQTKFNSLIVLDQKLMINDFRFIEETQNNQ